MWLYYLFLLLVIMRVSHVKADYFQKGDIEEVHYSIQDIISKYKNFTDTKREISLYIERPEFDTRCIKDSLAPILSQCLKKSISEIDPKLRSITAAKLSICEFQVAKIDYPLECQTSFDKEIDYFESCVISMERKSQWWTSYSGYYRTIGEICHYETLPYEKDAIWELFLNVTERYESVLEFLNEYVEITENFKQRSNGSFKGLMNLMNEMMNVTKLNKETNEFMWESIKSQLSKISEISTNVTDMALTQSNSIETNLINFMDTVDKQYTNSISSLRDKFLEDLDERDNLMMNSIEATRLNLLHLNNLMNENDIISIRLNENLLNGLNSSSKLNHSIDEMNFNVRNLNKDILEVQTVIIDMLEILNKNPIIKTILYATSQISATFEMILLFISMTSLFFFCLNLLNLDLFRFIGIGLFAILASLLIVYILLLLTSNFI